MDAMPLNLARPAVPIELAAIAAKMMAKDPKAPVPDTESSGAGAEAVFQGRELPPYSGEARHHSGPSTR